MFLIVSKLSRRNHFFRSQRMLFRLEQCLVHLPAHPSVSSRIKPLSLRKHLRFPIGELLSLGYPHAENNCGHFLDTLVPNSVFPYDFLQIHKATGLELSVFLKATHIIMNRGAHFDYILVRQYPAKTFFHSDMFDSEQKRLLRSGKLQKSHTALRLK